MKTIFIEKSAAQSLETMPDTMRERITNRIALYAEKPAALANQIKRLRGSQSLRLRVGDYRIVFSETATEITINAIGHRREIYR